MEHIRRILFGIFLFGINVSISSASEHWCSYSVQRAAYGSRNCGFWGWKSCGYTWYWRDTERRCCPGYRGSRCNIPICNPDCMNGGTCYAPYKCSCTAGHTGAICGTVTCSHLKPCFPGTCSFPDHCACFNGFGGNRCLNFDRNNNRPVINTCSLTLKHIRRLDHREKFFQILPCTNSSNIDVTWSNQERFNFAEFTLDGYYPPKYDYYPQLNYIGNFGFGIVHGDMHVVHTKIDRNGGSKPYTAFDKTYTCPGISSTSPEKNVLDCLTNEPDYKTSIEHGDILSVTFSIKSGGYATLKNPDNNRNYSQETFNGQSSSQSLEMKFDFDAPVHCSENNFTSPCPSTVQPLAVAEDITRSPVTARWSGWSDAMSGLAYYKVEAFKLEPTIHNELTEQSPLSPIFSTEIANVRTSSQPIPFNDTAMYSILLTSADKANNTKIARRLVLFDNTSTITITKPAMKDGMPAYDDVISMTLGDGGMHVISAIPETGFVWQTSKNGTRTRVIVDWQNHFVNKIHEDGRFLADVKPYPIQFQQLQEDGILRSKKFVCFDDNEGSRTTAAIPNTHGIVKFEVYTSQNSDDRRVPTAGWLTHNLTERFEKDYFLDEGSFVRLWVRATDIMNHTLADYTEVHIDNTPPRVNGLSIQSRFKNGTYKFTSRITFDASDEGSGVHKIGYQLFLENSTRPKESGSITANINNATNACAADPNCNCVLDICYLIPQQLDIDNCWFLVPKDDLNKSATINVTVYNQALLTKEFNFTIDKLSDLHGLEEYSGPTNLRVANTLSNGIQLIWDMPQTTCYGHVDIYVMLTLSDGSTRLVKVDSSQTSVDIVGLNPDTSYTAYLHTGYQGTNLAAVPFSFQTAPKENYLAGGIIAGIVIAVLFILGIMTTVFVILLRRGHFQPVRRGLTVVQRQARKSMAGIRHRTTARDGHHPRTATNKMYLDSLYMYGDMDYSDTERWQMSRDEIVLENLVKSGTFAEIYLATSRTSNAQVVAKTLKKNFSEEDKYLMKAKINFWSTVVGQHENVLRFIGAVVEEEDPATMGPMIIFEYCSRGQLNDYLTTMRDNLTLESHELLFRFGIHVARGMEYLVSKNVVHTRLASRNILLTADLDCKITGFSPKREDQATSGDGDAKKREKIPMKWVAPECMKTSKDANEKSDVWSYGVVLWEIFSLGDTPYKDVRGRDLPAKLKAGTRLQKPEVCDDRWYNVMVKCWQSAADKRPAFRDILRDLDEIFVPAGDADYYLYRR